MDWNSSTYAPKEILPRWLRWPATAVVNTHIRSVRPYACERHVLTQLRLLTCEYLATDLTKVTLNQILSQTTFQAFIPGLPA